MPQSNSVLRTLAALAGVAMLLGACSDDYLSRRDTIHMSGGDAVAANKVAQMVDPWPAYSADKNIAFNGQKMQSAVERYRNNRVTPPRGIGTSGSYAPSQQDPSGTAANNTTPVGPTVTQPAAAVK